MVHIIPGEYDVLLNGIRLHYTIHGSGPALIAISGGPGMDARCWDDFAQVDDFVTIVQLHPRGSGLSASAPDHAYLLPDYASDVEALRVHLGLERPIVMGWSHGGMIAQQFAFTYSDSLSRLILVNTSAYFGEFLNDREAPTMDLRLHLAKITAPTLVIVGRHDFITTVSMAAEMVKHLPHARLEIFEDSGHFAVIEEPAKFHRIVHDFIFSDSPIR